MGVAFDAVALHLGEASGHGGAVLVVDAFRYRDDASADAVVHRGDVLDELVGVEVGLGDVDQVRAVVGVRASAEYGGGGEEAGVATHDDVDLHAGQGLVVQVVAHEGLGDELRGGAPAGGVVVEDQVVVDGLGHVERVHLVAVGGGDFGDDAAGVGRVVAADVKEVADVVVLEPLGHGLDVVGLGLGAGRAEAGGRGGGEAVQAVLGPVGEVDEVARHEAVDGVSGAEDLAVEVRRGVQAFDDADGGLVDDSGGAAGLSDDGVAFEGLFVGHSYWLVFVFS